MKRSSIGAGSFRALLAAAALCVLALVALPGAAAAKDRNHDRIPDRWEKRHNLSLNVNQARRDQDHDGLRNRAEFLAGDNPRDPDTDNDGVEDGQENAGTIQSFDPETGRLVIDLFGSDTIAGMVTPETKIECEGAGGESATVSSDGGPGPSGEGESGDDSGPAGEPGDDSGGEVQEPGDDNGAEGQEPGDDNGAEGQEPGDDNGAEQPGDDHGDNQGNDEGGHGANCTASALVPGAVVREAELKVSNGQAVFEEVRLAP
jgi:hypothetical protein